MPARWLRLFPALLLVLLMPVPARAQGAGRSMDFETSIRFVGMGGASAGVAWGDPSVWGNVASLSRVTGVRWEQSRTQLVPGLARDVDLSSRRVLVGGAGIGVGLMGVPLPLDGLRLDYGQSDRTDTNGNLIATFDSYEDVRGEALAVSLPTLLTARARERGEATPLADAFDLAVGVAAKRTYIRLAPEWTASAITYDWGVQARCSPLLLPRRSRRSAHPGWSPAERLVLDLGAGYSVLNAAGGEFTFLNEDQRSPATRMHRMGIAMRLGMRMPPTRLTGALRSLVLGLDPLVTAGFAFDHDTNGMGGTGQNRYTVDHSGVEISIANVFTIRNGHWEDRLGYVDGPTRGWGLGLPVGPWAGFRYDRGEQPQATDSGLPDVVRKGWTAWCDLGRIWRDVGGARASQGVN